MFLHDGNLLKTNVYRGNHQMYITVTLNVINQARQMMLTIVFTIPEVFFGNRSIYKMVTNDNKVVLTVDSLRVWCAV